MDVAAGLVFVAVLGVGPVLYVRFRGRAGWRWFILGIASWAAALLVKGAVQIGIEALRMSAIWKGGLGGIVSAVCELGAAAPFLRRRDMRGNDLIAFGVGIGAFEVVFVTVLAWTTDIGTPPPVWWVGLLAFVVERASAMIGHVASRVLVHVSLRIRRPLPALIAIVVFASVDGVAAYGWAAGWDWADVHVLFSVLGLIAILGGVEAYAAWWYWRRTDLRWAPTRAS